MSEELTLEELDALFLDAVSCLQEGGHLFEMRPKDAYLALKAARAHLSRPVLDNADFNDAVKLANERLKPEVNDGGPVSLMAVAILAMSEQLAAAQEKVKALQPYKDAYDEGQDMFVIEGVDGSYFIKKTRGVAHGFVWSAPHPDRYSVIPVRVCKLVEGDGRCSG